MPSSFGATTGENIHLFAQSTQTFGFWTGTVRAMFIPVDVRSIYIYLHLFVGFYGPGKNGYFAIGTCPTTVFPGRRLQGGPVQIDTVSLTVYPACVVACKPQEIQHRFKVRTSVSDML